MRRQTSRPAGSLILFPHIHRPFSSLALLCFSLHHSVSVLNTDEGLLCCVFFLLLLFRLTFPKGHFPRLAECAHFHYETVDFGTVQVRPENTRSDFYSRDPLSLVIVSLAQVQWPFGPFLVNSS